LPLNVNFRIWWHTGKDFAVEWESPSKKRKRRIVSKNTEGKMAALTLVGGVKN
jgi:hypothetical protein